MQYLIIGNLENRRVTLFQQALSDLNQPIPYLFSHLSLIHSPEKLLAIPDQPLLIRIDSMGENAELEYALLKLGYQARLQENEQDALSCEVLEQRAYQFGELLAPRQLYLGFVDYLKKLAQIFQQRPQWKLLNNINDIIMLFDKRMASRYYQSLNIPIAESLENINDIESFRMAFIENNWRGAFIKLHSGSSASGLAYYTNNNNHEMLMTTLLYKNGCWFNSLKVRRINNKQDIDVVLNFLFSQGVHIEKNIPKARLDNAFMDCRILVIDNIAAFMVVRQNKHLITNLHLGGWRGNIENLHAKVDKKDFEAAMQTCITVYQAHKSLHIGIDLLFTPDFKQHYIIEANAFGDLLPNLTYQGHSVYTFEIIRGLHAKF